MSLATQMIADATDLLANVAEHAVTRNVKDSSGTITAKSVIIEHQGSDVEANPQGRNLVRRAMLGLPSTNSVDDKWQFDVDGDGEWWAVDRDVAASIADDGAGWLWIAVVRSPIVERGAEDYHTR